MAHFKKKRKWINFNVKWIKLPKGTPRYRKIIFYNMPRNIVADPETAQKICENVNQHNYRYSIKTVYRALKELLEAGFICKSEDYNPKTKQRFFVYPYKYYWNIR